MPSNERSAEFCRGALHVAEANYLHKTTAYWTTLLAAAEAREALQGSKEKMALSRIHEIASRQLAEPAGVGDAVAMAKICTEVEAVQLPSEAAQPTTAEVIAAAERALETGVCYLRIYRNENKYHDNWEGSEDEGTLLTDEEELACAIALIARWKEANGDGSNPR